MLLRIGAQGVNTSNIAAWKIYEPGEIKEYHWQDDNGRPIAGVPNARRVARIETTATSEGMYHGSTGYQIELYGNDAEAFLRWLDANATNLTPKTEMDEEWEAYKAKGGDRDRSAFENGVHSLRDLYKRMDEVGDDDPRWKDFMDSAARLEKRLLY